MLVKQHNGKTCTSDIPNIRGIRIDTITLDNMDILELLNLHEADIVKFLLLLQTCMWVPPISRRDLVRELDDLYHDLSRLDPMNHVEAARIKKEINKVQELLIE